MAAACKKTVGDIKGDITSVIDGSTERLNQAAANIKQSKWTNLLFNFIAAIILVITATCGLIYAQNYRDGTQIAEAKAVEALVEERAKFESEMKAEKSKLENELAAQKRQIENDAIRNYKNSEIFTEDACIEVASNIRYTRTIYYLYKYMRSTDLKEYPELKTFYDGYLKSGWKQYKEKSK